MSTKSTGELPMPAPGEKCPCCHRKMPKTATPSPEKLEAEKARRLEYNKRPDVIERRKAYQSERSRRIREALRIAAEVQSTGGESEE